MSNPDVTEQPKATTPVACSGLLGGVEWTQSEAIELCIKIEAICPKYGCHVALTGGLLYKQGSRKDCDILLYRIRQVAEIDFEGLWTALDALDFVKHSGFGWCYKCTYRGKPVDCFMPEEQGGEYNPDGEPPNDPSSATRHAETHK